jgi:spoIIIJ-associated protein
MDDLTYEATGETVGEAKWAALRELERRFPSLDRTAVAFQVLTEGERGLMGIGREPARVVATLGARPADGPAALPSATPREAPRRSEAPRRAVPAPTGPESTSPAADAARALLVAIAAGLGLEASVHVAETDAELTVTLSGGELGLLIGKHGRTIDALQYLVNAILARGDEAKHVVIDAQNYRRRREQALHETATRALRDVVRTGGPVSLEPMTSVERKIVHLFLQDHADVETSSDGREPYRFVVVAPRSAAPD